MLTKKTPELSKVNTDQHSRCNDKQNEHSSQFNRFRRPRTARVLLKLFYHITKESLLLQDKAPRMLFAPIKPLRNSAGGQMEVKNQNLNEFVSKAKLDEITGLPTAFLAQSVTVLTESSFYPVDEREWSASAEIISVNFVWPVRPGSWEQSDSSLGSRRCWKGSRGKLCRLTWSVQRFVLTSTFFATHLFDT